MRLSERRLPDLKGLVLGPDSFPSLKDLGCAASKPSIIQSLLSSCPPLRDRLESIWLRFPDPTLYTSSDIFDLLDAMASHCQRLSKLTLLLTASVCQPVLPQASLSWENLEPLLRMTLKHVCITHTMPLAITDSNVEALAASQPHIVELSLNPTPIFFRNPAITVSCLPAISNHCPLIERLDLFLDGEAPIALETIRTARATNLRHLFVGHSPVPRPLDFERRPNDTWTKLGFFLQQVLSPHAKIASYEHRNWIMRENTWEHEVDSNPPLQEGSRGSSTSEIHERWTILDQAVCGMRCAPETC